MKTLVYGRKTTPGSTSIFKLQLNIIYPYQPYKLHVRDFSAGNTVTVHRANLKTEYVEQLVFFITS
jgi:hypothetical protein